MMTMISEADLQHARTINNLRRTVRDERRTDANRASAAKELLSMTAETVSQETGETIWGGPFE